jgi:hypothetical protein
MKEKLPRAWVRISERLPEAGSIIACCAKHHTGVAMYWAGRVTRVSGNFATMEVLGEDRSSFIITHDTWWMRLPAAPPRF